MSQTVEIAAGQADSSHGQGGGDQPSHLAHHFDTLQQQFDAGKLGIWIFLVTEVLFFGGLFHLVFENLRLFGIELDDINKHPMAVGVFLFCYEVFLGLIVFASLNVPIGG